MPQANSEQWLSLSEASEILGVHPTTLRAWADGGYVRIFRTPGGHRRFLASEIRSMFAPAGTPELPPQPVKAMEQDVLAKARNGLGTLESTNPEWLSVIPADGREVWRESGRRLIGLAVQYVSRRQGQEAVLAEGKKIGASYGRTFIALRFRLSDSIRVFLFFRELLLRSTRPGLVARGHYDEEDARIHREMRHFLDEVLYAMLDAFEEAPTLQVGSGA